MKVSYRHIILFFFIFSSLKSISVTICVTPAGNNNNRGTIDQSFSILTATIDHVKDFRKSQELDEPVE
jgi:hypothetical protein